MKNIYASHEVQWCNRVYTYHRSLEWIACKPPIEYENISSQNRKSTKRSVTCIENHNVYCPIQPIVPLFIEKAKINVFLKRCARIILHPLRYKSSGSGPRLHRFRPRFLVRRIPRTHEAYSEIVKIQIQAYTPSEAFARSITVLGFLEGLQVQKFRHDLDPKVKGQILRSLQYQRDFQEVQEAEF